MSCAVCISEFWDWFRGDVEEGILQTDIQLVGRKLQRRISQSTSTWAICTRVVLLLPLRLILVPFLLLGKWTHAPCGQHRPVRNDETDEEYEVRYVWVYGSDGFFALGLVYNAVLSIVESADEDFNPRDGAALIIDSTFCVSLPSHVPLHPSPPASLLPAVHSSWTRGCSRAQTAASSS